jgi:hypothetical protein
MPGVTENSRSEIIEALSPDSFCKLGVDGHGREDGRRKGACVGPNERGQIAERFVNENSNAEAVNGDLVKQRACIDSRLCATSYGVANGSQQPRFEVSCGVGSSSAPH